MNDEIRMQNEEPAMLCYQNVETGKVIAREIGDEPYGDLWCEIDKEEYEFLTHPYQTEEEQLSEIYAAGKSAFSIQHSSLPPVPAEKEPEDTWIIGNNVIFGSPEWFDDAEELPF